MSVPKIQSPVKEVSSSTFELLTLDVPSTQSPNPSSLAFTPSPPSYSNDSFQWVQPMIDNKKRKFTPKVMAPSFDVVASLLGTTLTPSAKKAKTASRTMVSQLVKHERIETTVAKAKEVRRLAENMVQLGKKGTDSAKKFARGFLRGDDVIHKVFTEFAYRYKNRAGGYTRLLRTRIRQGDAAEMAYI
ncbi:hypothetical protein KI387_010823, partial [Taxus chinensis]